MGIQDEGALAIGWMAQMLKDAASNQRMVQLAYGALRVQLDASRQREEEQVARVATLGAENVRLRALLARCVTVIEHGGTTADVFHLLRLVNDEIAPKGTP